MSEWNDRVRQHPVTDRLAQLSRALEAYELDEQDSPEVVSDLERLRQIARYTTDVLTSVDPILVPSATLTHIDNAVQPVLNEVTQFVASSQRGHLANANNHADSVLTHLHLLPAPSALEQVEGVREAVSSFRRSAGQYLGAVEKDSRVLQDRLADLQDRVKDAATEITSQKSRLDNAIATFQQQFSDAESKRRDEFSSALAKREGEAEASIKANAHDFQELLRESEESFAAQLDQSRSAAEVALAAARTEGQAFLTALEELRDKAQDLLHVIGSTGMAGEYQKAATSSRHTAWLWQGISVLSMVGLIAFAIVAYRSTLQVAVDWGSVGTRVFVALTFGVLGAFGIRQSDRHMESEQRNRRFQLELSSIDPYLAGLPEAKRHEVKAALAERLFGNTSDQRSKPSEVPTGTSLDVTQVAIETLRDIVKKQ